MTPSITPTTTMHTADVLLAFEGQHPGHSFEKETLIRRELGVSAARFYQLLRRVIDTEEALRIDPLLTYRLRRGRGDRIRRT